jgi:hypothetical protein
MTLPHERERLREAALGIPSGAAMVLWVLAAFMAFPLAAAWALKAWLR